MKECIMTHEQKYYRIALLFNANKVYDRGVVEGVGQYLQVSQSTWDIFVEDDFVYHRDTIESLSIDGIIAAGNVDFIYITGYLWKIGVLVGAASISSYVMNRINNRMTYAVVRDIRSKAIRHVQVLPLSYLDAHSSGDIVSRIIADADQLSDGLLLGFTQLFTGVITIVATLFFRYFRLRIFLFLLFFYFLGITLF